MHPWFSALLIATTAASLASAQEKTPPPAEKPADKPAVSAAPGEDPMASVPTDKVSYNMGRTTGKNMMDVGFKPDVDAYLEGARSALEGKPAKYTDEEMAEAVKKFKAALPSDEQLKRTKALKTG